MATTNESKNERIDIMASNFVTFDQLQAQAEAIKDYLNSGYWEITESENKAILKPLYSNFPFEIGVYNVNTSNVTFGMQAATLNANSYTTDIVTIQGDNGSKTKAAICVNGGSSKVAIKTNNVSLKTAADSFADNISLESGAADCTIFAGSTAVDSVFNNDGDNGHLFQISGATGNKVLRGFTKRDSLQIMDAATVKGGVLTVTDTAYASVSVGSAKVSIQGSLSEMECFTIIDQYGNIISDNNNPFLKCKIANYSITGATRATIKGTNCLVTGDSNAQTLINPHGGVTINASTGADYIENTGDRVSIFGGGGVDTLINYGDNVTLYGGSDDDSIVNFNTGDGGVCYQFSSVDGANYVRGIQPNDRIHLPQVTALSALPDQISVSGSRGENFSFISGNTSLYGSANVGVGKQTFPAILYGSTLTEVPKDNLPAFLYTVSQNANVTINSGAGAGKMSTIQANSGASTINHTGDNALINANVNAVHYISHNGDNSSILTGAGNDTIFISGGSNNTIWTAAGADSIRFANTASSNILYVKGSVTEGTCSISGWSADNVIVSGYVATIFLVSRVNGAVNVIVKTGNTIRLTITLTDYVTAGKKIKYQLVDSDTIDELTIPS